MDISGAKPTMLVRIHNKTWTRLNTLKRPGESFDTVINRELDSSNEAKQRTESK